jgi:FAD/FMN-containing dehydrogenase
MFAQPQSAAEIAAVFQTAAENGLKVGMRGSGRSYGDAALNGGQVVMDMTTMNRMLSWDPQTGIAEVEPGFTIQQLWQSTLKDGWWPAVVPGTMFPTLAGCASMNVHGKNHFKVGGTGDQILDADLVLPNGQIRRISRDENQALFHAAIAGFGMLGCFSRIRLQLKKVEGGRLKVRSLMARNLDEQFALMDEHTQKSDYYVTWVDCIQGGSGLGRGTAHQAWYTHGDEDPPGKVLLDPAQQGLPGHIFGVPKSQVWRVLRLFTWNGGVRLMNLVKYLGDSLGAGRDHYQSHVAFAFLLDYVPNWRKMYEPGGFIQYQPFVPKENAKEVFRKILQLQQQRGLPSYLGVMKRHRPDNFLLSHAVDGYSFAMDFAVTQSNREDLWKLCHEMSELVLEAGGRFYPAKDAVLRPQDFARAWGQQRIGQFRALRAEADPQRILQTEWAARVGVDEKL